jgi:hypothetical protein
MTAIAGAWLPALESKPLPAPVMGAVDFGECLGMCRPSMSAVECGVQCARSLDVHRRGMPIYVPFRAQQLPPQFVGWSTQAKECSSTEQSRFCPDPAAPTIMAFAERNP